MARKPRKTAQEFETPDSFSVVDPGKLPYKDTTSDRRPVHKLAGSRRVRVDHIAIKATQYEFYFPIGVWHLKATKDFLSSLRQLAGGATVFKGATGVWREEKKNGDRSVDQPKEVEVEEDVYIYRMVVDANEFNSDANRPGLHSLVAQYMADLSVCDLISQREVMFSESCIVMDRSFLRLPGKPQNPAML